MMRKEEALLSALKCLYDAANNCMLEESFLKKQAKNIKFIQKFLPVNPMQAVLMAVGVAEYESGCVNMNDWMNHLSVTSFETVAIRKEIRDLVLKGLLKPYGHMSGRLVSYAIPEEVMHCVRTGSAFVEKDCHFSEAVEFFCEIEVILESAFNVGADDKMAIDLINAQVEKLMESNPDLTFVKKYKTLNINTPFDRIVLLYWAKEYAMHGNRNIELTSTPLCRIAIPQQQSRIIMTFKHGINVLISDGILEPVDSFNTGEYRFTDQALATMLCDFQEKSSPNKPNSGKISMIMPESIHERKLYFNDSEETQVNKVRQILSKDNYDTISQRLEKIGLRKGVCILLSGTPGVGKTELVLQLARECGRPVMKINATDIKDKFVGESERKVARVFKEYSRLAQESHTVPILFLNECDQLLLRRVNLSDTSSGGDKVDNAVSNMFLEQMESLDGIMICTTNCVKNLDNAFERRFLFKIELGKPDAKTRNSIWKSNFPTLSDEIIESLSKGYEFSGGQIENVTRKALIDQAISGIELSLQVMQDYCSHESYAAVNKTKPIGWGIQESCCLAKATTG